VTDLLQANVLERWQREPISFIEQILRRPKDGKPFELFDAQRQWFGHCWKLRPDGRLLYPEQTIGWAKKTGKGGTAAMQLLTTTLVFGGRNAEAYCVGADLQQAVERVFAEVKKICEVSPLLAREAQITNQRITFPQTGATITAIAGDYAGAAGGHPTITSFDELWTIDNERARRLFDEMVPVPTEKISCRLVTTHAGFSGECELLEEIHSKGMQLPEIAPGLRAGDGMLFTWRRADEFLAPWQDQAWLDDMRRSTRPLQYQRQLENIFVNSETRFITGEAWDDVTTLPAPPPPDPTLPVIIAIDAGIKHDSTAIVVCNSEKDGGVCVRRSMIFVPAPGHPVDLELVERKLKELTKQYPLCTIVYDSSQLEFMMQRFRSAGTKVVEFTQNPGNIGDMTENLAALIHYKKLAVFPDQNLRHAITNVHISENASGQQRFVKSRKDHNDVVIALAMAALHCVQRSGQPGYRWDIWDENFRDEDLPPEPQPEPSSGAVCGTSDWWKFKQHLNSYTTSDNRAAYTAIDNFFRYR
jgi:hypothetical protein